MKINNIRLFVKPYCGWCHEAEDWLDERGLKYETLDVTSDAKARQEMFRLSGQTLAPVIDVDGEVLADFDNASRGWKKGQWYDAVPPLTARGRGISIVDYFGRTMVANLPQNIRVGIVKCSVSGTKIELWDNLKRTFARTKPKQPAE